MKRLFTSLKNWLLSPPEPRKKTWILGLNGRLRINPDIQQKPSENKSNDNNQNW